MKGQQLRAGELIDPARLHLPEQRRDGDVGYVVDVHDRLGDVARRQGEHAGLHIASEEALAEVLREEGAAHDGGRHPALGDCDLAGLCLFLAAPRQQDDVVEALLAGRGSERREDLQGARHSDVGVEGYIRAAGPGQC